MTPESQWLIIIQIDFQFCRLYAGGWMPLYSMKLKVAQSCPTLCDPMDYTVHGILQARILEWVAFSFTRGSPNPGIEPRSPTLQTDSLPAEPPGKPKNTGVGRSPPPEDLPETGIEPESPVLQAASLPTEL